MGTIKTVKIVIDTNVMVSALLFGGTPGRLVHLWKSGRIRVVVSREIVNEYLRVLAYPRFNLAANQIEYLIYNQILPYVETVSPRSGSVIIKEDPSDDQFIRCAQASLSKIIVSGDHHLLALKKYGEIKMFTPSQLLKFLERQPDTKDDDII